MNTGKEKTEEKIDQKPAQVIPNLSNLTQSTEKNILRIMREKSVNSTERIFEFVENQTGVKKEDLIGISRVNEFVFGRMVFALIAKKKGYSASLTARYLNRDHSTILNLVERGSKNEGARQIQERFRDEEDKSINGLVAEKILGRYAYIYRAYEGKCAVCSFDEVVEVHHIVPRRMGGGDHPSNLVLLCPNHHALVDKGLMAMRDIHLKHFLSPESPV